MPTQEESILTTALHSEVENRFLTYALSTIVSRSLPDVRDGLKPVHRRILYAMWEMGLGPTAKFRKSAAVVGEVLGKFHPHGDQAAYDAMVRMAQDFSLRYPLVEGSGNFGSLDGDPAAAMRYTEARLSQLAEELLIEIEKETVGFRPNYDNSLKEPVVLPARFPNLLVNGSTGIAVGMATRRTVRSREAALPPRRRRARAPADPVGRMAGLVGARRLLVAKGRSQQRVDLGEDPRVPAVPLRRLVGTTASRFRLR